MAVISKAEWKRAYVADANQLRRVRKAILKLRRGERVENLTLSNALRVEQGLRQALLNKRKVLRLIVEGERQ